MTPNSRALLMQTLTATATTNGIGKPFGSSPSSMVRRYRLLYPLLRQNGRGKRHRTQRRFRQGVLPASRSPASEEREQTCSGKEVFFASKALPFCHERFAASTSKTGKTSVISDGKAIGFLGKGMVPKSPKRQTFMTMCPSKAEQLTLRSRQTFDSMLAIVLDKAHCHMGHLGQMGHIPLQIFHLRRQA